MKIALVILHADPARGGAERYTVDLANALAKAGHAVTLLSGDRSLRHAVETAETSGVRSVRLPMRGLTRSAKYQAFADAAETWLRNHPQDLVHAMLPMRTCDLYHPHAGLAVDALKGKPIQTFFNPRRRRFAAIERRLLTQPAPPVVLCLSDFVKGEFLRSYPDFPVQRLERLFNAIDLERFTPPAARPENARVEALLVAQSFKLKGVATALHALVAAPDVSLTVIGRDDPAPYLALARKLGVADRVEFPGVQRDVRPFYQRAGFLVLPTRRDSCSLVVLEAIACGLPVISTRFNGACEIMEQGTHGYILDEADDPALLADAMNRLADDTTRRTMQDACVALRPALAYEHHLAALMGIYERTLKNRRSGPAAG